MCLDHRPTSRMATSCCTSQMCGACSQTASSSWTALQMRAISHWVLTIFVAYDTAIPTRLFCERCAECIHQDPVWKHRKNRLDKSDPTFDYEAWKRKHIAFADAAVPRWVQAAKAQYGSVGTKYACVGYCFGAPYVCDELAGNTVTAGAFAHPAFLKERHFLQIKSRFPSTKCPTHEK